VNRNNGNGLYLNVSGISFWITIIAVIVILSSIGLGWLVKSIAVLFILLLLTPVIAFLAFRWWVKRNVVEQDCPVCGTNFVGINNTQTRCPNCGERITVQHKEFVRYSPPGTVDVDVIEVGSKELDASSEEQK